MRFRLQLCRESLGFGLAAALLLAFNLSPASSQTKPRMAQPERPTLYYVFDALCGWCYGFSPTMQAIKEDYKDRLEFEVISGGMVTGQRIGPIGKVAGFIRTAYKDVERATGTQFGKGFLEGTMAKGTATFSSLEPALALATVRSHFPEKAFAFAHALQHGIYYDGVAPTDQEAWAGYAEKFGVKRDIFLRDVRSPLMHQQALKEFRTSDSLKVEGFPTLFIMKNKVLHKIASGYTPKKELEARIQQVLAAM